MAEQTPDSKQATAATSAAGDPAAKKHRVRKIISTILIVVGCILAPLSVLGVWFDHTLLDTDRYVETVAPLADDHDVQKAVALRVSNAVSQGVDIEEKITDALPARASFLAEPISSAVDGVIYNTTLNFVQSDKFAELWTNANRKAHDLLVAILVGEGTKRIATENGEVVVKLGPIAQKVQQVLEDHGLGEVLGSSGPPKTELVLFSSDSLDTAQWAVDLLDTLAIVLPILTALLLAGGILLAADRRKALVRAALGVALAMGLVLTIFNLGRSAYIDALKDAGGNGKAGTAAFDQVLSFLRLAVRTVFVLALVIALGAWLAGPGKYATKIRTWFRDQLQGGERTTAPSGFAVFVGEHRTGLRVLAVGLGLAAMVAVSTPGPVTVLVVALLVLAAIFVIEVLGRGVPSRTT